MRRVYRRKRPFEYLLPFLIFVGVGVIGVLGFQLWSNLQAARGDVYFYVAQGKAKMLQYGTKEWETGYSGTKMLLGDAVKTGVNSRGVLKFFNGTMVRLGDDTEVVLTDITKRNDVEKIGLTLNHGSVWVNKIRSEGVEQSDLQVRTSHMLVIDVGTTFEVESDSVETVRVMKGNVNVQILGTDSDKSSILDTIQVGVGQELNLDEAVMKAFQNRETPSVLMALSDQFKLSDWYLWNSREDESPTDFSQAGNQLLPVGTTQEVTTQEVVAVTSSTQQTVETPGQLASPVITQPSESAVSSDQNKMAIVGTVGSGTAKVLVSQTVAGNTDEYALSKFKAGDLTFTYNVSEALGNYKSGENIYRFYAVDAAGNRSDSADVRITYTKTATAITEALSAPKVLKYNGTTDSTTVTGVVKVDGEVHGADKVVVNGYTLSKFVSGSTSWTYYANEAGGNLVPGENSYEVYSVDPQGNKSETVKFTITYNKPAGTTATSTATGTTQQSGTTTTSTSTGTTSSGNDVPQGF